MEATPTQLNSWAIEKESESLKNNIYFSHRLSVDANNPKYQAI